MLSKPRPNGPPSPIWRHATRIKLGVLSALKHYVAQHTRMLVHVLLDCPPQEGITITKESGGLTRVDFDGILLAELGYRCRSIHQRAPVVVVLD